MPASARVAAERLGATQTAVHQWVRHGRLTASGRPVLIDDDSIAHLAYARRTEALARIGDEEAFAQKVARILDPRPVLITRADGNPDPQSLAASMAAPRGASALHIVPAEAWPIWGPTVLRSAAARPTWDTGKRGCLTCWCRLSASVHQTMGPRSGAATRVLLGPPCQEDLDEWQRQSTEGRQQLRRARQRMQSQKLTDRVDRIHAERAAAMAEVQRATARFGRAHAEWKRLPAALRTGGRR
jgi:hypothetical protein